ncbi:hypothetical protein MMPV_001883 [Pyropia vietnamensis]
MTHELAEGVSALAPPRKVPAAVAAVSFVDQDASAPHVKIGDVPFFGGVETVFHSDMDTPVCRLASVCIKEDTTVVLPRWMRRHDDLLRYQCGLDSVSFTLPDREPPPHYAGNVDLFGLSVLRHHMPHFVRDVVPTLLAFDAAFGASTHTGLSRSCHTRDGSGCDNWPLAEWRSLNLSGVVSGAGTGGMSRVSPAVLALPRMRLLDDKAWVREFLRLLPPRVTGEGEDTHHQSGPTVLYPADLFGAEAEAGADVQQETSSARPSGVASTSRYLVEAEEQARAGVLADTDDAEFLRWSQRRPWWTRIRMVLGLDGRTRPWSLSGLLPSLVHQSLNTRVRPEKVACFRSATVGTVRKRRGHRAKVMSDALLNQLILYSANKLVKSPRTPLLRSPAVVGSRPTCKLRLTILNRVAPAPEQLAKAKDPFAFGRHIPRVRDVKEAILAKALTDSRVDLTLDIRVRFFEGMTLSEQVAVMQATDVLVGAHGAGLTNALFMRTNSSLVELAPFAYYATVFEELALTQASLRYFRFVAKPDDSQFVACMSHHHPASIGPAAVASSEQMVRRFKKAANGFRDTLGGNTHALQLHLDSQADFWARVCARSQSLRVDEKELAKMVVEAAVTQCLAAPGDSNRSD